MFRRMSGKEERIRDEVIRGKLEVYLSIEDKRRGNCSRWFHHVYKRA